MTTIKKYAVIKQNLQIQTKSMALWKRLADNVAKFDIKFQNDVIILSKKVNLTARVRYFTRTQGISFSVAILS